VDKRMCTSTNWVLTWGLIFWNRWNHGAKLPWGVSKLFCCVKTLVVLDREGITQSIVSNYKKHACFLVAFSAIGFEEFAGKTEINGSNICCNRK
jgi:hypothetical protein